MDRQGGQYGYYYPAIPSPSVRADAQPSLADQAAKVREGGGGRLFSFQGGRGGGRANRGGRGVFLREGPLLL